VAALAAFSPSPVPFILLMAAGFLVGTVGHLVRSNAIVGLGIAMIATSTLLLPLGLYLSGN